ncbi:MAG TPA: NADH-ubiquinone oxidoreductase-F iron-sulfur binding region domain-containing protein [Solirubrobacteraceae bacterium]|nr:NADH-ubiquinone oxidoreductase-F iron-sulfur binding region domain-containing protein [Solirubrobacteraceae bacterium]
MSTVTESALLPRLLRGVAYRGMAQLDTHLAEHGPLPAPSELGAAALLSAVERAGLRGRGGAAFPAAVKMRAVRSARGRPVVVANGCESEPMSAKDALLLHELPHLVLDGAALAARAVGASQVIVTYEGQNRDTRISLEHAIKQRQAAGADSVGFELFAAAEKFLTGQETSLISQINGGPPLPNFIPPRPTERGVRRRPTLVQNVETLAHLALIARRGADWYRRLGSAEEPGSTLVTVAGAVRSPGVYEIEIGTPLEALFEAAGGHSDEIAGLLVGGYFGSWLPAKLVGSVELSNAWLRAHRAALGCGVLVALPQSACPVAEVVRVAIYLATETANQCGPCVHGSAALARTLHAIALGKPPAGAGADLRRWTSLLPGRGACHLPDGLSRFVATALATFTSQFEEHARRGPCRLCATEGLLVIP